MSEKKIVVGIDIGATNLKIGLVDDAGNILDKIAVSVEGSRDDRDLFRLIVANVQGLLSKNGVDANACGCGVPGIVDYHKGVVYRSPNFPSWENVKIRDDLSTALRLPVSIDNDANLHALAEYRFGAGKSLENMILLTLGTGIGGGLLLNGEIFRGDIGFAGEIGHITVEKDGVQCSCGNRGCWEKYAASAAFDLFLSELSNDDRDGLSQALKGDSITPSGLAVLAKAGNSVARSMWRKFGAYLGMGMADLINILGVTNFVIGGGISESIDLFIDATKDEICARTYRQNYDRLSIKRAALGNDAGILGAAAVVV